MRLNWGPYLWMRCYNNGAQFLDEIVGDDPDWARHRGDARTVPAGCKGTMVSAVRPPGAVARRHEAEVSLGPEGAERGRRRLRAALESLAYLIALGVRNIRQSGQSITRNHRLRRYRPQSASCARSLPASSTVRWSC